MQGIRQRVFSLAQTVLLPPCRLNPHFSRFIQISYSPDRGMLILGEPEREPRLCESTHRYLVLIASPDSDEARSRESRTRDAGSICIQSTTQKRFLEGKYENDGVVIDAKGISSPLRLTDIIVGGERPQSHIVSFSVNTTRKDTNQDTIGSLQVMTDQNLSDLKRQYESFCVRETLFLVASASGGSNNPPFVPRGMTPMAWGTQQNVWFSHGLDGSLIVKLGKYTAAAVGVLPFYTETIGWARFNRIH